MNIHTESTEYHTQSLKDADCLSEDFRLRRTSLMSLTTKFDYADNNLHSNFLKNGETSTLVPNTARAEDVKNFNLRKKDIKFLGTQIEKEIGCARHNSHIAYYSSKTRQFDSLQFTRNYTSFNKDNLNYKNYYVPKCIVSVSLYPFYIEMAKILKSIYNYCKSFKLQKPIEKVIENLVIEVPVPPRGLLSVTYQLFNEKYILTQSPMNQLSFLSIEYEIIFINFNLDQILEIYRHVLLETRIIFFSSAISKLNPIIQGFISLIYPFKYLFQVIPILPHFDFLESPAPYIMGINKKYENGFFTAHNIDISDLTILVVDIDCNKLELYSPSLNEQIPLNIRKKFIQEEVPELPKHYKSKLIFKINEYINKIKANTKQKEDKHIFSNNIRDLFFQFMVNIFQNYNNYLNIDYYTNKDISNTSISCLFRGDDYVNSICYTDRLFYKKFKETQMFADFIYKRMIPKDSNEKMEILLFEENLIEKKNRKMFSRKVFTPFIHSNAYNIKSTYSVPRIGKFSQEEINFYKNLENVKLALKYGQEIRLVNEEIIITYPIFPILMTDIFFKNSVKPYYIPHDLSDEIQTINVDIISKSHLGSVSIHQCEMDNYVYLCWIQIWAMTFWYHDREEKKFRFQQLLKVLDMVINHEMEIFNLLFDALSKHGEDFMILKLYERLIYYRLNPSFSICTNVMKLINEKKVLSSMGVNNIFKYLQQFNFNEVFDESKFRSRGLKNKYDYNILHDCVKFYTLDLCIDCENELEIDKFSSDFQKMGREVLWLVCPNPKCRNALLPKIGVKFGAEINSFELMKYNTSSYDRFVLHSPFHLKNNINNGLLNEFGLRLNIDTFKNSFNQFFWGSIWYFKMKGLAFDFMLPYINEKNCAEVNNQNMANVVIKKVERINRAGNSQENSPKRKLSVNSSRSGINPNSNKKKLKFSHTEDIKNINEATEGLDIIKLSNQEDVTKLNKIEEDAKIENKNDTCNKEADLNKKRSDGSIKRLSFSNFNLITNVKSFEIEVVGSRKTSLIGEIADIVDIQTLATAIIKENVINLKEAEDINENNCITTPEKENIENTSAKPKFSQNLPIELNDTINFNLTYRKSVLDSNQNILPTEQSFINPQLLLDNSACYDTSRILDTEISSFEIESPKGFRMRKKKLNTIKEETMEYFFTDQFKTDRIINKIEDEKIEESLTSNYHEKEPTRTIKRSKSCDLRGSNKSAKDFESKGNFNEKEKYFNIGEIRNTNDEDKNYEDINEDITPMY